MRVRASVRVGLLVLLVAAACRPREAAPPRELRVVSLSPSTTGVLLALGVRRQIVGVDRFSAERPDCAGIPALGGLFAPDLERTLELRPSLVVGVRSESQASFFDALRARGIAARELETGGSLDSVLANYEVLGALVGRRDAGHALAGQVRGQLDAIARSVAGRPRVKVALVVERDPVYVVAGGSFASALIEIAGGANVFADLPRTYPEVSLELLAERAPELLIDSTQSERGSDAQAAARDYWRRVAAVKRVELLPPGVATLPGAELARGAELLRSRIHPELGS